MQFLIGLLRLACSRFDTVRDALCMPGRVRSGTEFFVQLMVPGTETEVVAPEGLYVTFYGRADPEPEESACGHESAAA